MNKICILDAKEKDAQKILWLLVEGFGESYLKYTPYQGQNALKIIRSQIKNGKENKNYGFFVLQCNRRILGFYNWVNKEKEHFLNYLAVASSIRGSNFGNLLLEHFESLGSKKGCRTLGLEVFKSNEKALMWYKRKGYREASNKYITSIGLEHFKEHQNHLGGLIIDGLDVALREEKANGISSVACQFGNTSLLIGLIDSVACRVNIDLVPRPKDLLFFLACLLGTRRNVILISRHLDLIADLTGGLSKMEEVIYMVKDTYK